MDIKKVLIIGIMSLILFLGGIVLGFSLSLHQSQLSMFSENYYAAVKMVMVRDAINEKEEEKALIVADQTIKTKLSLLSFLIENPTTLSKSQAEDLQNLVKAYEKGIK